MKNKQKTDCKIVKEIDKVFLIYLSFLDVPVVAAKYDIVQPSKNKQIKKNWLQFISIYDIIKLLMIYWVNMALKGYGMFQKIFDLIKKYDKIIIHRHKNPDGDALGS